MKILFVAAKLHVYEPFGIMHLSPQLKADGHRVRLMDSETPELLEEVCGYEPQLICYSVCSGSHAYYTALNRWLKAHVSFTSVFGGPHPTFHPDLINEKGVDAICRGEGDHALPEFCREFEAQGRPVAVSNFTVRTESGTSAGAFRPLLEDLDKLPFLDRELYYDAIGSRASHGVQSFFASRGCPFSCSYCFNHTMDGLYGGRWKRVRVRSPENLIDEIAGVVGRYPAEYVSFRESIFPLNAEWLRRFVPQYSSRIGLPFYCHLRLDLLTEERVRLLATAGCYSVNVGIETGTDDVRSRVLGRPMSTRRIVSGCELLRRHGIKIVANNLLGLPGGSFADDLETLRLNQRCKPDYSVATLCTPFPGTRLAKYAEEHGCFDGHYDDLPASYYDRSPLKFASETEKRRIENLQRLFAVASILPGATGLVRLLTYLPRNRVFDSVFRTMYMTFHRTHVFPSRMGIEEWRKEIEYLQGAMG